MKTKQTTRPATTQPKTTGGAAKPDEPAIDLSQIPSVADLARLAPPLPHGEQTDPETAAKLAVAQWEACEAQREALIFKRFIEPWLEAKAQEVDLARFGEMPKQIEFPVALEKFLLLALPDQRTEDRAKTFREFTRSSLQQAQWEAMGGHTATNKDGTEFTMQQAPLPTDDRLTEALAAVKKSGISEPQYMRLLVELREFAKWYRAETLKARNKAGGTAARSKVKRTRKARPPIEKLKAVAASLELQVEPGA